VAKAAHRRLIGRRLTAKVDANEVPDLYFLKSRSMGVLENVAAPFPPRSAKAETSPLKRTHQEHYPHEP